MFKLIPSGDMLNYVPAYKMNSYLNKFSNDHFIKMLGPPSIDNKHYLHYAYSINTIPHALFIAEIFPDRIDFFCSHKAIYEFRNFEQWFAVNIGINCLPS